MPSLTSRTINLGFGSKLASQLQQINGLPFHSGVLACQLKWSGWH